MTYAVLPLTEDPWQVFTLDLMLDGEPLHAQIELRYFPAAGKWFFSLWDHAAGELLVNQIPVVCSYGVLNDLLFPFRHMRGGKGVGSLFCLRGAESPSTPDPAEGNLTEFQIIIGDTFGDRQ